MKGKDTDNNLEENRFDAGYWEKRYEEGYTGWDTGAVTTPLKTYFDQLVDKNLRILIPGGGNSYEAEYLFRLGFGNVWVVDVAHAPLQNLLTRCPDFPKHQLIQGDFFDLKPGYDLIVEQTFLCALEPAFRPAYARKMAELLNPGGKLMGLLFDDVLNTEHPPFGGNKAEYEVYFKPYFHFKYFETAYNSIKPRAGRELFILLEKI